MVIDRKLIRMFKSSPKLAKEERRYLWKYRTKG